MIAALPPPKSGEPAPHSLQLLQQIADTLDIEINAFHESSARYLFHTAEDGTQWFLVSNPNGRPAIRRVGAAANCSADEPMDKFMAKNLESPQGLALADLIDRLLLDCLR